jgi:flavodoxin
MSGTNILITYYSRAGYNYAGGNIVDLPVGNTEVVAGMIQRMIGGDLFKIDTVKPYPTDYHEATDVAKVELRENARPELTDSVSNMERYDIIYLGYPNWWGTMPMPVFSFLESYEFAGKIIAPFCTHEGSGMGRSERDITNVCPESHLLSGLAIRGSSVRDSENVVVDWMWGLAQIHTSIQGAIS